MLELKGCRIQVIYITSGDEGPDGITGDRDHIMTGFASDSAFDLTDSGKLLLHTRRKEEFIIARNRNADLLLQKCFY